LLTFPVNNINIHPNYKNTSGFVIKIQKYLYFIAFYYFFTFFPNPPLTKQNCGAIIKADRDFGSCRQAKACELKRTKVQEAYKKPKG